MEARVRKDIAQQCLVIATSQIPTPNGWRPRFAEEIAHAIMREFLGWSGM
jgi:hypothetical protein